ncbi:MAG: hypothetical protein ACLQUY_16570 [Ktedonobacterales bacterium]
MSNVIVFTNLTLDGVMQAPGEPDEDRRESQHASAGRGGSQLGQSR